MTLKQKAISGVFWTTIQGLSVKLIQFIVVIIISRILTPKDFGLIGMLYIFVALGNLIIDAGFGQSLIRKKNISDIDYNSIFLMNILFGIIIYILLFFIAPYISLFFDTPELENLSRILFLIFPINSFAVVHNAILSREIKFKTLAKISLISVVLSGIISIFLAFENFGVWALVYQTLLFSLFNSILLWIFNRNWRPSFIISIKPIREMLSFSLNLFFTNIIIVLFNNIYTLIIGKQFSPIQVGYYNQAKKFEEIPVGTLTAIIQKVSYPILSQLQDNNELLKNGYRKIIIQTIYLAFPLMLGLIAISKNVIVLLLTDKWLPAVPLFTILCFHGALFPLHSINVNILKVKGNGKMLLRLEIIRRLLVISAIIVTIRYNVITLLFGHVVASIISVIINMYYCGKEINFSLFEQIMDIIPYFFLASFTAFIIYLIGFFLNIGNIFIILMIQILLGLFIYIFISYFFKLRAFTEMYNILLKRNDKK